MKTKYIVMAAGMLLFTACEDYLDIKPKGQSLPDNVNILDNLLNEDDLVEYEAYTFWMTDDIDVPQGVNLSNDNPEITERLYNFEEYYLNPEDNDGSFDNLWKTIDRANIVLDNIETAEGNDETQRKRVKGEALAYRGTAYWHLCNVWCPPYSSTNADQDETGLPLRLSHSLSGELVRSTLNETYDQIIEDLTAAINLLPETGTYTTEASAMTANGMLALVYFQKGDYANALTHAQAALAIENQLHDYNTGNPMDMYGFTPWSNPEYRLVRAKFDLAMHPRSFATDQFNRVYLSAELSAAYDDQVNDLRYTYFVVPNVNTGGDQFLGVHGSQYFAGVSIPSLMLTLAECEARVGDHNEAMNLVNQLRDARFNKANFADQATFENAVYLTASSSTEAINHVLAERRRELRFTAFRFYDIRRLNALHDADISVDRLDRNGQASSLPANDNKWTLPFPQSYLALNPELTQNPR